MEQGAHFRGQQVFWQFIMNHRHLAECQRCRIIDGNRKLSGIPGMVDRCRTDNAGQQPYPRPSDPDTSGTGARSRSET